MYEAGATDVPTTIHFLDVLLKLGVTERIDLQVGYAPVAMRQRGDRAGWLGGANIVSGRSLSSCDRKSDSLVHRVRWG